MAVDAGGARLIKEEKQNVSLKSLKSNEIQMLFTLVIVAVAALVIYFILLPMYNGLADLEKDNDDLRNQEYEIRNQIAQAPGYQNMHDEARADYFRYIAYFYSPMAPELIDERITSMLIAHGMTPATLTMTTLTVEGIPAYMAQELRADPVPIPLDSVADEEQAADNSGQANAEGGGSNLEDAADAAEAAANPTEEIFDDYAFVYTVSVSAHGDRNNLFTFLAQVAPMTAMYVTDFSYIDPVTEKASEPGGKDIVTPGVINMTIKMYVFVEGVPANPQANSG